MNVTSTNGNACGMEIVFYQDRYSSLVNKDQTATNVKSEHVQEEQQKKRRNNCHGNLKLQRYRRKVRKQGLNSIVGTQSSTTGVIAQQTEQNQSNRHLSMRNTSVNYIAISDEVLSQKTSAIFDRTEKFNRLFNEDQKIQFLRQYMALIDQFSYQQLQESQWKYYHHIGMTQNIWHGYVSKTFAEKHSICSSYGKSETLVEQRLKEIESQLKRANSAIEQFEQEILSQCEHNIDCFSAMLELSSTINQLIHEKQQSLQYDLQYKRNILLLDATDHRLVTKFFDLKPNKNHVIMRIITRARHIWKRTKEQMMIEADIATLEKCLTSTSLQPSFSLVHEIINNVDLDIKNLNVIIETSTTSQLLINEVNRLKTLKIDIIQQAILTSQSVHGKNITVAATRQ
ncbi:unnamed protein product [Adineta ricciae]|uniref:Uncharacterized protein n=1 Tax=Adineta ricciae TaxID=249248 RepID=A0A816BLV6_ADIRI|nr:unnamed protein product [Adineta ricciae]